MTDRHGSQVGLADNRPSRRGMPGGHQNLDSALATYKQQLSNRRPNTPVVCRWERAGEFQGWLNEATLQDLAFQQAKEIYRAAGGRKITEFNSNSIEEIRDAIDFLLYDPLSLEGRFSECVNRGSSCALGGSSKEFASYLLCIKDPQLLGVWSAYSERALAMLGLTIPKKRNLSPGTRYVQYLDLLWGLRRTTALADFQALDGFLYWLSRIPSQQAG